VLFILKQEPFQQDSNVSLIHIKEWNTREFNSAQIGYHTWTDNKNRPPQKTMNLKNGAPAMDGE
jgi:hypothetical protein